jgi:hypothetical protein
MVISLGVNVLHALAPALLLAVLRISSCFVPLPWCSPHFTGGADYIADAIPGINIASLRN